MHGLSREKAGEGKHARATARSWAKVLLSQLMEQQPNANEFCVRLVPKSDKTITVEVTLGAGD